jgi:hypothetical protein
MSNWLRLLGAVSVVILMVPTVALAEEPPDTLWSGENDVVLDLVENQDVPSAGGLTEGAQYGWEPLGIVAGGSQIRRHSVGSDVWEVWLCNTGPTAYTYGATGLKKKLNERMKPYYKWLSEGKYTLSFVVGGTVNGTHDGSSWGDIWTCLEKVYNNSAGNRNGAVVVLDEILSYAEGFAGLAGPGGFCTDGGSCGVPNTFPGNGRYALLGAETFSSNTPWGEPLTSVGAHEMGHALHFPHSSSGNGDDYNNPIDVMSGNNTLFDGQPSTTEADPYATLGFNRYAAGWIPSSDVVVFDGGTRKVKLVKPNIAGKQLVVIRLAKGRYLTVDARLRATHDPIPNSISGAAVHIVDQRPNCPEADGWGMTACFGILRTHLQKPANPYGAKHVLHKGQERNVAGYLIKVLDKGANFVKIKITEV